MRNIKTLVKIMYKNNNNLKSDSKFINIMGLIFFIVSIVFLTFLLEYSLYQYLGPYIIPVSLIINTIIILLYSIPQIFNEIHESSYFINLIVLPINEFEILISKLIVMLIVPYIISFIILLTTTLLYGVINYKSGLYYILSLLGIIITPLIIIIPIIIITIILSKFINKNNKMIIKKIFFILPLISSLLIIYAIKFLDYSKFLYNLKNGRNIIIYIFPSNFFIYKGLINSNYEFLSIVLLIISIIIYFILLYRFSKQYLKVTSRNLEIYSNNKKQTFRKKTQINSLISKDFKILKRNPFFFANFFLKSFITPLSIILLIILSSNVSLNYLVKSNLINMNYIIFIIIFFQAKFNIISVTSLSREKNDINNLKILPVENLVQIKSKILLGFSINFSISLIIIIITKFIFNISYLNMFNLFLSSVILCLYGSISAIIINLKYPMINYINEKDIVNFNSNIINLFLLTIIETFLSIFIIFKLNLIVLIYTYIVIYIIFAYFKIKKIYSKKYDIYN